MLDPRVYSDSYGLRYFPFHGDEAGLYLLRGLSGRKILSTSPFLTDTPGLPSDPTRIAEYQEFLEVTAGSHQAEWALVKTRDLTFAHGLGSSVTVETTAVTTTLDLSNGEQGLLASMDRKRKRQIDRGYALGPVFEVGRDALLEDFYSVFVETQTRLGTPAHAKRYFAAILKYHPTSQLLVGYLDGAPVSCALLLTRGSTVFHPYTGTLKAYLSSYLNCSLYWEMFRHAIAGGATQFDLGRSFTGSGVHHFKKYWGGTDVPLYYCYRTHHAKNIPDFSAWHLQAATRVWSLLPRFVARNVGPLLIRSVP